VASAEIAEVVGAASTGAEAGVAWTETEVMVVVLIGGVVDMVAAVVAGAMVVALEDMREVVVAVEEGGASRMPMGSRSRPTKCFIIETLQPHLF